MEVTIKEADTKGEPISLCKPCSFMNILLTVYIFSIPTFHPSLSLSLSLVSFSNGRLDSSSDVKAKHSLYQEKGMKRRTLVTKTDHMTYIGTNYETEATMSTFPFRK